MFGSMLSGRTWKIVWRRPAENPNHQQFFSQTASFSTALPIDSGSAGRMDAHPYLLSEPQSAGPARAFSECSMRSFPLRPSNRQDCRCRKIDWKTLKPMICFTTKHFYQSNSDIPFGWRRSNRHPCCPRKPEGSTGHLDSMPGPAAWCGRMASAESAGTLATEILKWAEAPGWDMAGWVKNSIWWLQTVFSRMHSEGFPF